MNASDLYRRIFEMGPDVPRKWTETEKLYLQFRISRDAAVKKDCRGRLAAICIKAVGHLTPPWQSWRSGKDGSRFSKDFDAQRHKARAPWVYRWVDEQLKTPQMDLCRFIGRRCKNALVNEIRAAKRKHRVKPGPVVPPTPAEILQRENEQVAARQEVLAQLGKHTTHATGKAELTAEERLLAFDSCVKMQPIRNVDLAKQWDCSEGKIRKIRANLLKKLKLGKKQRTRHWEEKEARERRAEDKAAKRGVKDVVWWDKKRDGNPFEISTKI